MEITALISTELPPEAGEICCMIELPAVKKTVVNKNVSKTQRRNCVKPTKATPIIFPSISSKGRTEETITSTIRFDFSSCTPPHNQTSVNKNKHVIEKKQQFPQ